MKREHVSSTAIADVGYEPTTKVLEVRFVNGGLYRYRQVPPEVFEELMAAPSKGRYLQDEIIDLYPYQRLD